MPLFSADGIREVWLVNLAANVVEVYRDPQPDGTYTAVAIVPRGGSVSPLAFSDLVIPVDQILGT